MIDRSPGQAAVPRSRGRSRPLARTRRLCGLGALVSLGLTVWLGLWVTPPSVEMGQLVRLVYIHPPVAWVAYLAFGVTTLASIAYLWPRTRSLVWDRLAGASAEVGVVFAGLTLATGSIWGRPTWGVWWTWDARLTTTALLAALYIGYLALRRFSGSQEQRAKRSALAALIAFADVPVNYLSVYWWQTLHQTGTVLDPSKQLLIHGIMAWTLLLGFVAFTLAYVWVMIQRYEVEVLESRLADEGLALALAERMSEGVPADRPVGPSPVPDRRLVAAGGAAARLAAGEGPATQRLEPVTTSAPASAVTPGGSQPTPSDPLVAGGAGGERRR